jgi:hypothetical protein
MEDSVLNIITIISKNKTLRREIPIKRKNVRKE